jgi:hypothetical protein
VTFLDMLVANNTAAPPPCSTAGLRRPDSRHAGLASSPAFLHATHPLGDPLREASRKRHKLGISASWECSKRGSHQPLRPRPPQQTGRGFFFGCARGCPSAETVVKHGSTRRHRLPRTSCGDFAEGEIQRAGVAGPHCLLLVPGPLRFSGAGSAPSDGHRWNAPNRQFVAGVQFGALRQYATSNFQSLLSRRGRRLLDVFIIVAERHEQGFFFDIGRHLRLHHRGAKPASANWFSTNRRPDHMTSASLHLNSSSSAP